VVQFLAPDHPLKQIILSKQILEHLIQSVRVIYIFERLVHQRHFSVGKKRGYIGGKGVQLSIPFLVTAVQPF
jgi:hypothetical protein